MGRNKLPIVKILQPIQRKQHHKISFSENVRKWESFLSSVFLAHFSVNRKRDILVWLRKVGSKNREMWSEPVRNKIDYIFYMLSEG